MLNDPMTRAALSAGGEDSLDPEENPQRILDSREGSSTEQAGEPGNMENEQPEPQK